ncbi:MAG: Gx transporter family protein [Anaeromicrobium sp.]|jgi:heptaprenyl diphosphate synthase|uniref:Gx transporter family protein n=1 Tax=Anaeromicrobium sp. TaxID=1929132 RepID=UPI0025F7F9B8|nr:Gx transporter family protein [Anaeromicrobium sp.]MCT4592966.1 Gx transporter family protein [Anaeromicrobium sp.]
MLYPDKRQYTMSKTQKIIFISLLVSQAVVLSFIEKMIPLNFSIPGAKLGLANIITLTSLYLFSFKETFSIILLRTIMVAFIGGSISGFLYSISGALLSFLVMYLLMRVSLEKISTIGVSVTGAIFHNLGQLLMAAFIIQNLRIIIYLPLLMVTGVITGVVVGITVKYLLGFLLKIKYFN